MNRKKGKFGNNRIRWIEFKAFKQTPFVFAGLVVKNSKGKSFVFENNWKNKLEEFLLAWGYFSNEIVIPKQIHQDRVISIKKQQGIGFKENCYADGVLTNQRNLLLTIQVADCVPVYIVDPKKKVVGLIHSGWRGTLMQIAKNAIDEAKNNFGCSPKDLKTLLGPSIGKCCYEVAPEIAVLFPSGFVNYKPKSKPKLDLAGFIREQLLESGVRKNNIFSVDECTYCGPDFLCSYRKDKNKKARMLAFVGIK